MADDTKYTFIQYKTGMKDIDDLTKNKLHILTDKQAEVWNKEQKERETGSELIKVKLSVTKVN